MFLQERGKGQEENSSKNKVGSLPLALQTKLLVRKELSVFRANHCLESFISFQQETDRDPLFLNWALVKSLGIGQGCPTQKLQKSKHSAWTGTTPNNRNERCENFMRFHSYLELTSLVGNTRTTFKNCRRKPQVFRFCNNSFMESPPHGLLLYWAQTLQP